MKRRGGGGGNNIRNGPWINSCRSSTSTSPMKEPGSSNSSRISSSKRPSRTTCPQRTVHENECFFFFLSTQVNVTTKLKTARTSSQRGSIAHFILNSSLNFSLSSTKVLPELLRDILIVKCNQMWLHLDDPSSHFKVIARNYLNAFGLVLKGDVLLLADQSNDHLDNQRPGSQVQNSLLLKPLKKYFAVHFPSFNFVSRNERFVFRFISISKRAFSLCISESAECAGIRIRYAGGDFLQIFLHCNFPKKS
ncbi:hypothetical protein CEXT_615171 [Caerostris extrusa]|uniref:Uncharacterized protein n=1 Tax=Caerostris extrusa TaxID=172846 RepID=A0AAV4PNG1_CAEEX|nr:hypothetical protein CEXT_615171 [Caerostris extrusa]